MTEEKKVIANIVMGILGLVILITFFSSYVTIKQGEVGVVTRFGKATGREMGAGFNWKAPFVERVIRMDTKIKRVDANAGAGTKDLQTVGSEIVLNYHILPQDASDIFSQLGDDDMLYDKVIYPAIQEVVKSTFSQYRAEELLTKREEVKTLIDQKISERLLPYWVTVDDVSLTDITFSEEFDSAIEAKQVAEQVSQKALYEVETAKAEAEKNRVQTLQLTPEILQKMWIEKWNGQLPQVISDGSTLMYSIK
jgi:regulator of protease activity HflC (stomatin/prohibitin superfamily)